MERNPATIERVQHLGDNTRDATMIEEMTITTVVSATPHDCYALITNIERYPEWATDVTSARVVERDRDGVATQASFRVEALGRAASYKLAYDHGGAPRQISWKLIEGDLLKQLDGRYEFNDTAEAGRTEVVYQLALELAVLLPAFVKRRAERRIAHTALADFSARVESNAVIRRAESPA